MVGMSGNSMLGFKDLPEDHRLHRQYRVGAAVIGLVLLVFGILGFVAGNGFVSQHGDRVLGLGSNGLLSVLSVVAGLILLAGVAVDGNVDAYVNTVAGAVFMLAGLASLAFLRTSYNYLDFSMWNVIFSFVVGMVLFAGGLYGRVSE
jgi:hypothetical protein